MGAWRLLAWLVIVWLLTACQTLAPASAPQTAAKPVPAAWRTQPPTPPITPAASQTPPIASPTAVTPTTSVQPSTTPATICTTPGRVETATLASGIAGPLPYRLYLPPCYGEDGRAYPILIMLGGNIHDDSIWDELGLDETTERQIQAGTIPPLIIVMPAGGWIANNSSGGPGSYETVIVEELRPLLVTTTCASPDPERWALGGLSRGGYWALEIAFRFPELFGSVGGHSAALLDQYAGPAINPQTTALTRDLGDLRIYLDIGSEDYVRANTIRLHKDLVAAGIDHTWVLQNGRHDEAYWQSHTADYLRWYTAVWPQSRAAYAACPPIKNDQPDG